MKADRRFIEDDLAGPEVIGAIILFGLFVTTIAVLNATSVPAAGLAAEEEHYMRALATLNALQTEAESAGIPGNAGATVARSLEMGPERSTPKDFVSYFMATPASASGEVQLVPNYGNVTVSHLKSGNPNAVYDVGAPDDAFPVGRLTFDPHPIFRGEGVVQLENGGIVATSGTTALRYAPPITVSVNGGSTLVAIKVRVQNGSIVDIGGGAPVRVSFASEAATLNQPASDNARSVTYRMETAYGSAWGAYLNATSTAGGLAAGSGYTTSVQRAAAPGGLDVVTWTVEGLSAGATNDVRLTTGVAIYRVTVS